MYCFLLFSIARYIFKSPRICFWGTKYDVYRERVVRVVYLHYILWRRARLWLELFASRADCFFSRVSYLPSHVFLRRHRSFPFRKPYACLEKFLFLAVIRMEMRPPYCFPSTAAAECHTFQVMKKWHLVTNAGNGFMQVAKTSPTKCFRAKWSGGSVQTVDYLFTW